jgi:predicted helicase
VSLVADTHTLEDGIDEVFRRDNLGYHAIHTKFHKRWLRYSKVDTVETDTRRQHDVVVSLLLVYPKKENI